MATTLSPTQEREFERLMLALPVGNVFVVFGGTGLGKTTILRQVHQKLGGIVLEAKNFVDAMRSQHPLALEETFEKMVVDALEDHDVVIVDDLHMIQEVSCCHHFYPRAEYLDVALLALSTFVGGTKKKLIFGHSGSAPGPVHMRCIYCGVRGFAADDYEHVCRACLKPEDASNLDYGKIHRFAPKLNAHQLKSVCVNLGARGEVSTDKFIGHLRTWGMMSNVELDEVQPVRLRARHQISV